MKLKFLLAFLVCTVVSFAQSTVAIYVVDVEGVDNSTKQIIGSEMVTRFAVNPNFTAVERTTEFLTELKKEQLLQKSGNASDQNICGLGKKYGVDLVCVTNILPYQQAYYIQARVLNVEDATVLSAVREVSTLASIDEIISAVEELTNNMLPPLVSYIQQKQQIDQQRHLAEQRAAQQQQQARQQQQQQQQFQESMQALQASTQPLAESISDLVQLNNSWILEVHNTKNSPYQIIVDGQVIGVINPQKAQRFFVPIERYGQIIAIQQSGYLLSPTKLTYTVNRQQKKAVVKIKI